MFKFQVEENSPILRSRKTLQFSNIKLFNIFYPNFFKVSNSNLRYLCGMCYTMRMRGGIQDRATKMVIDLRSMEYEDRLNSPGKIET